MERDVDPYLLEPEDLSFEIIRRNAVVPATRIDQEILLEQLIVEGHPTFQTVLPFEANFQRARTLLLEVNKLLVFGQLNADVKGFRRVRAKIHTVFAHIANRVSCLSPSSPMQETALQQLTTELQICERLLKAPTYAPHTDEEQLTLGFARLSSTGILKPGESSPGAVESPSYQTLDRTPLEGQLPQATLRSSEKETSTPMARDRSMEGSL